MAKKIENMDLAELEKEQQGLMAVQAKIRAQKLAVQALIDAKEAKLAAERKLAAMSEAEREAMAAALAE